MKADRVWGYRDAALGQRGRYASFGSTNRVHDISKIVVKLCLQPTHFSCLQAKASKRMVCVGRKGFTEQVQETIAVRHRVIQIQ